MDALLRKPRIGPRIAPKTEVWRADGAASRPRKPPILLVIGVNVAMLLLDPDTEARRWMKQRFREVNTKSLPAVRAETEGIYSRLFPQGQAWFVRKAFAWADDAFSGRYADYQGIDAKYHDLEHTLQGTLCFARLLEGYKNAQAKPELTQRAFELGLLAILLHDTGYLKRRNDTVGTGAKYTLVHVARSAEFAAALLREQGFSEKEIRSIQNMIRCTGVNADLGTIPFQDEIERRVGFALGTADLLGQMAADDYIDKLEILYAEFEESNLHSGRTSGPGVFTSLDDLRQKTPMFWEKYVVPKINRDFLGLHSFLCDPWPDGPSHYLQRIKANIRRLQRELSMQMA